MNIFIEDNTLKKMIETTIVFYIFYKLINRNRFKNIAFADYCSQINDKRILNNILDAMHEQGIDIFVDGGIKKIQTIINDEFKSII
jgi:signal-transduction protein with cAMP-binding, CBS, and nucleotidyltransferase domain